MLPSFHIISGFIFSLILKFLLSLNIWNFLFLFFCTWVFDIDHYFWFVLKKKNPNPFQAYRYFIERNKTRSREQKRRLMFKENKIFIFHAFEVIFLIFFLSFFILKIFNLQIYSYLFLIGIFFHLFLDLIESLREGFIKERCSLILFFISKSKLEKEKKKKR